MNNTSQIFDPEKVKPYLPVNVYVGGKEHGKYWRGECISSAFV